MALTSTSSFQRPAKYKLWAKFLDFLEAAPNLLNRSKSYLTEATAVTVAIDAYQILVSTRATEEAKTDTVTLPAANSGVIGQRHLIKFQALGDTGDKFQLTKTNVTKAGVTIDKIEFDAAGEWVLVENRGSSWEIVADAAGVVVPVG